ncbi:GSCOCG00003685001-RA-CDS [Cotesia congregata]|uniref:Uncharacterized protein n=1 Tax=Cotesia congregata TaxID=51543 RepID=A0A8J2HNN2_COTCN|nr:GSCOCG00003685001-RA-CDS [Cotesia congregata]CAG5107467.1 Protein of unknown function [Cotesia congregata]
MAGQYNLSSSILSGKPDTGSYSYRCVRKSGQDVHTDLLRIVSQMHDSTDALNNNYEAKVCKEEMKFPYLQSINDDETKKIITPQELLTMKLLVEKNENLPYQYELVSTNSFKRIISHPQLKQYLLLNNPKKHIANVNRFPLAYST